MRNLVDIWRALRLMSFSGLSALLLAGCGAIPDGRGSAPPRPSASAGLGSFDPSPLARQCFGELQRANVQFSPLPNRNFAGGCSQIDSIRLLNVGADVSNLGPVRCELARHFAAWTEFAVKRAARQYLGGELARIETMGSYSCRTIAGSSRLSQHAHANAIDVAAFVLTDGRRISVLGDWDAGGAERRFLKAIHASACRRFGTVLGPNYNAAHRDHFHFDMGGQGYCR